MSASSRMAKILEGQGQSVEEWGAVREITPGDKLDRKVRESADHADFLRELFDDLTEQRERGRAGVTKLLKAVDAGEDDYKALFLLAVDTLADTLANQAVKIQVHTRIKERERRQATEGTE